MPFKNLKLLTMKKNLFLIFYFLSVNIFAQEQFDCCDKTLMDMKFQIFDVYQNNNFGQKNAMTSIGSFNSWSFNLLYKGLLLGPTVTSTQANVSFPCTVDGQDYYQKVSLNKMLIGVTSRLSFGNASLGMIKEATFFEIEELGFAGNKLIQRFGAFFDFNFLFQRENNFFNRSSCSFLLQYLEKSEHLDNFFFDFNSAANLYEVNFGKFGFSPLLSFGIKKNEILLDQQYYYGCGLGFSFNKSKENKSRNNFISLVYRRTAHDFDKFFVDGLFLEINFDPYYLGIFKDDF